jgi:hypothetical protein
VTGRTLARAVSTLLLVLVLAGAAAAEVVKVTRDRSQIWSRRPTAVVTVARTDTLLEVIRRDGDWYVIRIPESLGGHGESGYILAENVIVVPDDELSPVDREATRPAPIRRQVPDLTPPPPPEPALRLRGFGTVGLTTFFARDSFRAIFDEISRPAVGGGGQLVFRNGLFVQGNVDYHRLKGERVFVFEDEVFRLGIEDTVTIVPIYGTVGYRFPIKRSAVYGGGGVGVYLWRERSDFADDSEDFDENHASFHGLIGVESRATRMVWVALEGLVLSVPDALGSRGVSQFYGESNLGGFTVQVKFIFGK